MASLLSLGSRIASPQLARRTRGDGLPGAARREGGIRVRIEVWSELDLAESHVGSSATADGSCLFISRTAVSSR
ncbi:hypothetical protein E2562_007955 [Oryza meyeriana var. granulata]|uniref:Uncharacterized protein n=1 Tax=Oryza meyeriana var. granulata TaxID=110450 RepID=A0A6G1DF90_9ORYZ|nr:hypothetical protein E2562_007955 [Oryza meyeriana var. granulata]